MENISNFYGNFEVRIFYCQLLAPIHCYFLHFNTNDQKYLHYCLMGMQHHLSKNKGKTVKKISLIFFNLIFKISIFNIMFDLIMTTQNPIIIKNLNHPTTLLHIPPMKTLYLFFLFCINLKAIIY